MKKAIKKIDKTEEFLMGLHKATGLVGKELEAAYLVYASMIADIIGTEKQQNHFNDRIKNFSFES